MEKERQEQLATTNPLFSNRKLKLGTFCTNLSGGCTISTADGILTADWASATRLAKMADAMEFEAIVPVGRWRGFGGETDFNGSGFESFTFAAGMAAQTEHPALFATSHVPSMHPVMAAKQATTVDHISGGRFALNLVTGWHKTEIEIFGAPMLDHDVRYDCAAEWLEIIKQLWSRDDPLDFAGQFFKVEKALLKPRPIQQPRPPVMCAGASTKGRDFAARYCDISFMTPESRNDDMGPNKARVESIRAHARESYGREVQVWTNAYIFQADTEDEARKLYDHVVHQNGDRVAVDNLVETMGIHSQSIPVPVLQQIKEHFIAGWGGYPIIGTKDQVVDKLAALQGTGLDGVLLSWPRYVEDMARFQTDTAPLLVQAGLR